MLDFDGPVTYLFINGRNRIVANQMRQALLPASTFRSTYGTLPSRWSSCAGPRCTLTDSIAALADLIRRTN
jgi:hypothetical protein